MPRELPDETSAVEEVKAAAGDPLFPVWAKALRMKCPLKRCQVAQEHLRYCGFDALMRI